MIRLYTSRVRPSRHAQVARRLWDWLTEQDGAEPKEVSLTVEEGAFRDWWAIRADGRLESWEGGLVGGGRWGCGPEHPWMRDGASPDPRPTETGAR
jgi:hypothetical protein